MQKITQIICLTLLFPLCSLAKTFDVRFYNLDPFVKNVPHRVPAHHVNEIEASFNATTKELSLSFSEDFPDAVVEIYCESTMVERYEGDIWTGESISFDLSNSPDGDYTIIVSTSDADSVYGYFAIGK